MDMELINIATILAILYMLFFNSFIVLYKFHNYKAAFLSASFELAKELIYVSLYLFIIFLGLTINRVVLIVGSLFLFLSGAIASYYLYSFKTSLSAGIITDICNSGFAEASKLVSALLVVWIIFTLSVCISTIKHFSISNSKLLIHKILSAVCLLIFVIDMISPSKYGVMLQYFPIQYLHL